jgi:hypothetical protein
MAEIASTPSLEERLLGLQILALGTQTYLGKIKEEKTKISIVEAVECVSTDFEQNVKVWIKKDNLGELSTVGIKGNNYTLFDKDFTAEQIYLIKRVAAEAEYKMSRAVKNLENNSID